MFSKVAETVTYQNVERMELTLRTILGIMVLMREEKLTHSERNKVDATITILARRGLEYSSVHVGLENIPF